MKAFLLKIMFLFILVVISVRCEDDSPNRQIQETDPESRLKRILLYETIDSQEPLTISEVYEYDIKGRISKVFTPIINESSTINYLKYSNYEYNNLGQLVKIIYYNANTIAPDGYLNLQTSTFEYDDNGNKTKEFIEYPKVKSYKYILYFYINDLLIRSEEYNNLNKIVSFTVFDYNDNKEQIKESLYTADGELLKTTSNEFQEGLLTSSNISTGTGQLLLRTINYTYNYKGKLIVLESVEHSMFSSTCSYVLRYEYE